MIPIYLNITQNAKSIINRNVSYMFDLLLATCEGLSFEEGLDSIFPRYILDSSFDKCVKTVKELKNMTGDGFEREEMPVFYEWTLYHTIVWWMEVVESLELDEIPQNECISEDGTDMYSYLNNPENYLDFLFVDWDFLSVDEIYLLYKKRPNLLEDFLHIDFERYVELMPDDIQKEYKIRKERKQEKMDKGNRMTFTINGGQVNIATDNATIHAIQNSGIDGAELDRIISNIKESLSELKKDDADRIIDAVDMVQEEMKKSEPKSSRLRSCLSLLAPMMTIANGIPVLASNLQKLQEFVLQFIK